MKKRNKFTFTLPPDLIAQIEKFDSSKSATVAAALRFYLENQPNFYTKSEIDVRITNLTDVVLELGRDVDKMRKKLGF